MCAYSSALNIYAHMYVYQMCIYICGCASVCICMVVYVCNRQCAQVYVCEYACNIYVCMYMYLCMYNYMDGCM